MTHFLMENRTVLLLALGWNFSAFLSAMPELPDDAPYFVRWIHDYAQLVAANLNKRTRSKLPNEPAREGQKANP